MNIENRELSEKLLNSIESLKKSISTISVYDFNIYSSMELYYQIADKLNEVIEECYRYEVAVSEEIIKQNEMIQYMITTGMIVEVANKLGQLVADGTMETLINQVVFTNLNEKIDSISMIMPPPSTVDDNTTNLQNILDLAKNKDKNLTVRFPAGEYELYPCTIYDNTTIKLTNNTILKSKAKAYFNKNYDVNEDIDILFFNAVPHDDNELNITGYNGRSNIVIDGGIFNVTSAFCLIHGQNITIKNAVFKNANYDHYMQIGSCKNVLIENCEFIGVTERASNRQYVEFVQIDWATFESMPYWRKDGAIYDNDINNGIEIRNCKFKKGSGDYAYLPTAIGSHAGTSGINNKNITIKGCEFDNFDFAGLTLKYMDNVIVEDNKFISSSSNTAGYGITIDNCFNVEIGRGNYFTGGARSISMYNSCNKIKMCDFTVENSNRESDIILIGESNNIVINNITFKNCISSGEIIKSRNNNYVSINNCKVFDCIANGNFFANIYMNSNGSSSNVDVSNNSVSFAEVYFNPNVKNVKRTKAQSLWSGAVQTGTITLNDDIEKYQNLFITCDIYGLVTLPLHFDSNKKTILKTFNFGDDTTVPVPSLSFFEVELNLSNNEIIISKVRELNFVNGNISYVDNPNSFYLREIKGTKFRV